MSTDNSSSGNAPHQSSMDGQLADSAEDGKQENTVEMIRDELVRQIVVCKAMMKKLDKKIKAQGEKRKAQDETRKAKDETRKAQYETLKAQYDWMKAQDERMKAQDERMKAQDETLKAQNETLKALVERRKAQDERMKVQDETLKALEAIPMWNIDNMAILLEGKWRLLGSSPSNLASVSCSWDSYFGIPVLSQSGSNPSTPVPSQLGSTTMSGKLEQSYPVWKHPDDALENGICTLFQDFISSNHESLQRLKDLASEAQNTSEETRKSHEKSFILPFVTGMVLRALPGLRMMAKEEFEKNLYLLSDSEPLGDDESEDVCLYRCPHATLFTREDDTSDVKYDHYDSTKGMAMSIEVKWNITNNTSMSMALQQCDLAFANVSGRMPAHEMRTGFSVVTDGLHWRFLRMSWVYAQLEWSRRIEISPEVSIDDLPTLSRWLTYSLKCALANPPQPSGINYTIGGFSLLEVLGNSNRSLTIRWKNENEGDKGIVTKWWKMGDANNVNKMNEAKCLELFAGKAWCVQRWTAELSFTPTDNMMCLVDAGRPLESFYIAGHHGQELARVVKKCIWDEAIGELAKLSLSHHDIHEGNIIISPCQKMAILADFESISNFDDEVGHLPTKWSHLRRAGIKATAEHDRICTAAVLHCLWDVDISSFHIYDDDGSRMPRSILFDAYSVEDNRSALVEDIK